jgi:putative ABC transport system permease protein
MLRNYLAAALRNLLRNRAYAAINICGLALGFATTILIALLVRYEYGYDRFFPDHDRIFQLQSTFTHPGQAPVRSSVIASKVAEAMKLDFPAIETSARLAFADIKLRSGNIEGGNSLALWADPDFFRLFPMRAISGNLPEALSQPDGIVLTSSIARRFFGRDDAIGKVIELNRQHAMRVIAVVEDLPANTNLQGDVFVPSISSFSTLTTWDAIPGEGDDLNNRNVFTYVRLRPGASVSDLNNAMGHFVERHFPGQFDGVPIAQALTLSLIPIADIHLQPATVGGKPPGDLRTVHTMIAIALLILLVAGCNFVSMMSARAAGRGIEVGVRKAVGATRRQIQAQFLCECLFYVGLAMALAVVAVNLLMPGFNAFLQRDIGFNLLRDPALATCLFGTVVVVGLAAGAYPAFVLSMFRPSTTLKGTVFGAGKSGRLRQALVIFQFGTLIVLIVATLTIHRQTQYAMEDRLHIPGDQIYIKQSGCPQAFVDAVKNFQGVRAASCAGGAALTFSQLVNTVQNQKGDKTRFAFAQVGYGFFDLFGITPVAGRLFAPEFGEDDVLRAGTDVPSNPTIITNETGARALGFALPKFAVSQSVRWSRLVVGPGGFRFSDGDSPIVGVIPDFPIGSVRNVIEPTMYYVDPSMFDSLILKLDGAAIPETLHVLRTAWARQGHSDTFEGMFLSQYLNSLYSDISRLSTIFSIFAGVVVVIAALGLLGLAVFTAERRTREIGLRKVMGASRWDILRFLGWQFIRPVLWANALAWPLAYFLMQRWLETFAYHVDLQALTFGAAGVLALIISLATVSGHALIVARAKPVDALRHE